MNRLVKRIVKNITLLNEQASEAFAVRLATYLSAPLILSFSGEIGAGKTTLIRAMLRAVGIQGPIKSPTFSLIESYPCQNFQIHHFDLYRIHDEAELEYIGFRDYFLSNAICCVEWPERAGHYLDADINFALIVTGNQRLLTISAYSLIGETILSYLCQ